MRPGPATAPSDPSMPGLGGAYDRRDRDPDQAQRAVIVRPTPAQDVARFRPGCCWPGRAQTLPADGPGRALSDAISRMHRLQELLVVVDDSFADARDEGDSRSALFSLQRQLTQAHSNLVSEIRRFKQRCDMFPLQREMILDAFQSIHSHEFHTLQQLNSDLVRQQISASIHEAVLETELRHLRDEMAAVQNEISAADRHQLSQSIRIRHWKDQTSIYNRTVRERFIEQERNALQILNDLDQDLKRIPEKIQQLEHALTEAQHQADRFSIDKSRMEELLVESLVSSAENGDGIERLVEFIEKHMEEKAPWIARQLKRTIWFATLPLNVSINMMKAVRETIS